MKTLLATLTIFACTLSAHARIGETLEEIEARFGKPIAIDDGLHMWKIKEMAYGVKFDAEGKSASEMIMPTSSLGKITDTQADTFLNSHVTSDVEWEKLSPLAVMQGVEFGGVSLGINPIMEDVYRSKDGRLLARRVNIGQPRVMVFSHTGAQMMLAEKKAKEAKDAVQF